MCVCFFSVPLLLERVDFKDSTRESAGGGAVNGCRRGSVLLIVVLRVVAKKETKRNKKWSCLGTKGEGSAPAAERTLRADITGGVLRVCLSVNVRTC